MRAVLHLGNIPVVTLAAGIRTPTLMTKTEQKNVAAVIVVSS